MPPDSITALSVVWVIGFYADGAAIVEQAEVVGGFGVVEPHCHVAPLVDSFDVLVHRVRMRMMFRCLPGVS